MKNEIDVGKTAKETTAKVNTKKPAARKLRTEYVLTKGMVNKLSPVYNAYNEMIQNKEKPCCLRKKGIKERERFAQTA